MVHVFHSFALFYMRFSDNSPSCFLVCIGLVTAYHSRARALSSCFSQCRRLAFFALLYSEVSFPKKAKGDLCFHVFTQLTRCCELSLYHYLVYMGGFKCSHVTLYLIFTILGFVRGCSGNTVMISVSTPQRNVCSCFWK